ncbi:MAG: glutamine synthetase [Clostridiales bacterium]|jgi:glutamine synthetase|nr:glutamine synthetase [Clostridiales bacterium]
MLDFDLNEMLFCIKPEDHKPSKLREILQEHPEVKFISLVGIDLGGHGTDEKIPIKVFMKDMEKILNYGVQTDGSSVALPIIVELNNAKVDIIPDVEVNWYVDQNYNNIDIKTGLPVGTLRLPSYLKHNDKVQCGSRVFLKNAVDHIKREIIKEIENNPYVYEYLDIKDVDEIEEVLITSATELEFWVKTPDDRADREQLFTAQVLKEQYWKRTMGPVRSALEQTLEILDFYGFEIEMGHKEVGGVKAKMGNTGQYDHIMEQLEIDWKYADALQAADNEHQVKAVVRDVFTQFGLDVTFLAKPIPGVAGSGEHTHLGIAAKLKNGETINLFTPKDKISHYMSPIGFGALMGLLKNYEVINPFVSATNDAFDRLKPGFEAPVCIVTSLGRSVTNVSRNRTVLVGLIRDNNNNLATRFELRAPNPHSNTYLVLGASYLVMLDGIRAVLKAQKTPYELEQSMSKKWGEEDFYLEKNRLYRTEENVFTFFSQEERDRLFGIAPASVWENMKALEDEKEKLEVLLADGIIPEIVIKSYRAQMLSKWKTELHDRLVPNAMNIVRECVKAHDVDATDYDINNWNKIDKIRHEIGKDSVDFKCLLKKEKEALDMHDFDTASELHLLVQAKIEELRTLYIKYRQNLF